MKDGFGGFQLPDRDGRYVAIADFGSPRRDDARLLRVPASRRELHSPIRTKRRVTDSLTLAWLPLFVLPDAAQLWPFPYGSYRLVFVPFHPCYPQISSVLIRVERLRVGGKEFRALME